MLGHVSLITFLVLHNVIYLHIYTSMLRTCKIILIYSASKKEWKHINNGKLYGKAGKVKTVEIA